MIVGVGCDLVSVARIRDSLERLGERFARRVLDDDELQQWRGVADPAAFVAKRFAAKEATGKALGTGIGSGISWREIAVGHDEHGAPVLYLAGAAAARASALGAARRHLSISDERAYAIALVILESAG